MNRYPALLLSTLLMFAPVAARAQADAQDDRAKGLAAFAAKDYETAFNHLNSAYSANTSDKQVGERFYVAAIHLMMARYKGGDYAGVESYGQWAGGVDFQHIPEKYGHLAPFYRGLAFRQLKKPGKAIEVIEAGRGQFPEPHLDRELGLAYFETKNWPKAAESLREYVSAVSEPPEKGIYIKLAEAHYEGGDSTAALGAIDEGLEKYPDDGNLLAWRQKFAKEAKAEGSMQSGSTWHFEIRFENVPEQDAVRRRILGFLEDAYNTVTTKFGYYPKQPTLVVIYASRDSLLHGVEGAPDWMAACYDGKLRIPIQNTQLPDEHMNQILRHEFTHAIVHMIAEGKSVPGWLDEGVAQLLANEGGRADRDFRSGVNALKGSGRAPTIPLAQLNAGFSGFRDRGTVNMAYAQAYLFVAYLEKTFGFWKVEQMIESLGKSYSLEDAIKFNLGGDLASHEKKWVASQLPAMGL